MITRCVTASVFLPIVSEHGCLRQSIQVQILAREYTWILGGVRARAPQLQNGIILVLLQSCHEDFRKGTHLRVLTISPEAPAQVGFCHYCQSPRTSWRTAVTSLRLRNFHSTGHFNILSYQAANYSPSRKSVLKPTFPLKSQSLFSCRPLPLLPRCRTQGSSVTLSEPHTWSWVLTEGGMRGTIVPRVAAQPLWWGQEMTGIGHRHQALVIFLVFITGLPSSGVKEALSY